MQLVSIMTLFLPHERHEERHGVALSMPPIKQFPYTYSRQMDHMLAVLRLKPDTDYWFKVRSYVQLSDGTRYYGQLIEVVHTKTLK